MMLLACCFRVAFAQRALSGVLPLLNGLARGTPLYYPRKGGATGSSSPASWEASSSKALRGQPQAAEEQLRDGWGDF